MGQLLRGSAATTHAVRAAIRRSKASISVLSARHGVNPKTVAKWKKRDFLNACNFAKRLKTLRGLTVFEFISRQWIAEPHRFHHHPDHLNPGLNI